MDSDYKTFTRQIYFYAFMEGMVFWYAIEKLFMQSIGITIATIVVIGIVAQAGKLIFEIPSSILADRWSRRKSLLLASFIMLLASILIPFANSPITYVSLILLWTLFIAIKSGTDVAFIFDSLRDVKHANRFQNVMGRYHSWGLLGLIISSTVAGFVADATNLQIPFWLTVIPITLGAITIYRMSDPPIDKESTSGNIWLHAKDSWSDIKRNSLVWVALLYASLLSLQLVWYEYYQLFGISVNTPESVFGISLAVLCLGLISGSELAHRVDFGKKIISVSWVLIVISHLLGILVTDFIGFLIVLYILRMLLDYQSQK